MGSTAAGVGSGAASRFFRPGSWRTTVVVDVTVVMGTVITTVVSV